MDNHRSSTNSKLGGIPAFLVAVAFLAGPQARAQKQQPTLTAPYAKAALLSLFAIESDSSAPQHKNDETEEASTTQQKIDATDAEAATEQEASITKMLRQMYRLRLQDNDLVRAYQKLAEIENAQDASEQAAARNRKDYAVAQLADNEAEIKKREDACFGQLEESLRQRSPQNLTACSEWIRKAKISDEGAVKVAF